MFHWKGLSIRDEIASQKQKGVNVFSAPLLLGQFNHTRLSSQKRLQVNLSPVKGSREQYFYQ